MTTFHEKYRPKKLDRVIGQEKVVTRLKGILSSGKLPNAMLFAGPTSAGKTTLARAFTADLFGVDSLQNVHDYEELNAASARGIDDIRELMQRARFKPRIAPKRVILIDEAQQLTGAAAQLLLKPLENPPPSTLFILGSMEPERLLQAMKNRCSQFVLESQPKDNLVKFARRIAKAEAMDYVTPEVAAKVAENSNGEMRTTANLMEALSQYVAGSGVKKITDEVISEALSSTETVDDQIAVRALTAVYCNKYRLAQVSLLDTQDGFRLINTLLRLNTFLINVEALKGEKHKTVWWSDQNKDLREAVKKLTTIDPKNHLHAFATVQSHLIDLRMRSGAFMVSEANLIADHLFKATQAISPMFKGKE